MSTESEQNLSRYCRTCAKTFTRQPLVPLYDSINPAINAIKHYQNNNFKISNNDGLPKQICSECLNKFNVMNDFLENCERAQELLETLFKFDAIVSSENQFSKVKFEYIEEEDEDEEYIEEFLQDYDESKHDYKLELIGDDDDNNNESIIYDNSSSKIPVEYTDDEIYEDTNCTNNDNETVEVIIENVLNTGDYINDSYKEDETVTLSCNYCFKLYNSENEFKTHVQLCNNKKSLAQKIMCDSCGESK